MGDEQKLPIGNCSNDRWSLRPIARLKDATKNNGGHWQAHNTESGHGQNPDGRKVPGIELSKVGFNCAAAQRYREVEGTKQRERRKEATTIKNRKDRPGYPYSSGDSRKAASAQIAKIPFPLAQHIARVYYARHGDTPNTNIERVR